jgi:hypothetical protein
VANRALFKLHHDRIAPIVERCAERSRQRVAATARYGAPVAAPETHALERSFGAYAGRSAAPGVEATP